MYSQQHQLHRPSSGTPDIGESVQALWTGAHLPHQRDQQQQQQQTGSGGGPGSVPGPNAGYMFDRSRPFGGASSGSAGGAGGAIGQGLSHQQQQQQQQQQAAVQPPLLLNNLAQHLNNPPPPPSSSLGGGAGVNAGSLAYGFNTGSGAGAVGGVGTSASGSQVGGGKLLLGSGVPGSGTGGGPGQGGQAGGQAPVPGSEEAEIYGLITELLNPLTRETALLELSKKREMYDDLALVLWGGFGIMSSLLLEIVNVYPALSPPALTAHASNRVCNTLALLQCVASHSETRGLFLAAHVPLFLYPFLNTTSKTRPFEYLRLTSLGVIGALVKNDNSDVVNFLLSTEIIPLCLRIMETGSELSKTVAIFIVQKILSDDLGLQYICQTYERFYAVGAVLANMTQALVESQAARLLKHVVRCYLRMTDNPRAREALRACLPESLRDRTFEQTLKADQVTKRCLQSLLQNLDRND